MPHVAHTTEVNPVRVLHRDESKVTRVNRQKGRLCPTFWSLEPTKEWARMAWNLDMTLRQWEGESDCKTWCSSNSSVFPCAEREWVFRPGKTEETSRPQCRQ